MTDLLLGCAVALLVVIGGILSQGLSYIEKIKENTGVIKVTVAEVLANAQAVDKKMDDVIALVAKLKALPTLPDGSVAVPQTDIDALGAAVADVSGKEDTALT